MEFNSISDRHFKNGAWPPPKIVAKEIPSIGADKVFLALYKQLYYRHLHWHLQGRVTVYVRFDSWEAYCNLFKTLVEAPAGTVIPEEWLYDIVDEFIYQFRLFGQYRTKQDDMSEEEFALLTHDNNVTKWNIRKVQEVLFNVTQGSGIFSVSSAAADSNVQQAPAASIEKLGYFALVGLCRLQLVLGDYHTTLALHKVLASEALRQLTHVHACNVMVRYCNGVACLMTRRYAEAAKIFSSALMYTKRVGAHNSHHHKMILKQSDKMLHLLAIAHSLCPGVTIADGARKMLHSKMERGLQQLQSGGSNSLDSYVQIFKQGMPRFLNPHPGMGMDPSQQQVNLFISEVRHHHQLPKIHTLLKLYRTLSLTKLNDLGHDIATDENVEKLRCQLICLKFKTRQDSDLGNAFSGTHFWLDNAMIHVDQEQKKRNFAGFFMHHLEKLGDVVSDMRR